MPKKSKARGPSSDLAFNHAMIYVREIGPALHFYADLLGFKVIEQYQSPHGPVYARLRSPRGPATIALHIAESGQELPQSAGVRLYFEVKQLEKLCKNLEASGVKLSQPPKMMPWGWKHAYLHDPDGHEVSLYWAGVKRLQKTRMPNSKRASA